MAKNHRRKSRARNRQQRTGASYASAAAGTTHRHPVPDLAVLRSLPYAADRPVDVDLAGRLIGACRAGCKPCQDSLIAKALKGDRATIATIAGAVYGLLPTAGPLAGEATRSWHPLAQQAQQTGDAGPALAALDAMALTQVAALLDDALDHWAAGGLEPDQIHILDLDDDDDLDDDGDAGEASYAVYPGQMHGPDGPLPILLLEAETPAAAAENLRERCGWPTWTMDGLPPLYPEWRLRVQIATRSLLQIARIDEHGDDDLTLWDAAETVPLPPEWWDLLDRVQHVLLCGPASPGQEQEAAEAGRLGAVVARVSFW